MGLPAGFKEALTFLPQSMDRRPQQPGKKTQRRWLSRCISNGTPGLRVSPNYLLASIQDKSMSDSCNLSRYKHLCSMTYLVTAGSELERQYEHTIRKTVEGVLQAAQHPRTVVSITLQVVSDDGALLACALNAACAALVDAAVPMTSIFGVHLNSTLCQ